MRLTDVLTVDVYVKVWVSVKDRPLRDCMLELDTALGRSIEVLREELRTCWYGPSSV